MNFQHQLALNEPAQRQSQQYPQQQPQQPHQPQDNNSAPEWLVSPEPIQEQQQFMPQGLQHQDTKSSWQQQLQEKEDPEASSQQIQIPVTNTEYSSQCYSNHYDNDVDNEKAGEPDRPASYQQGGNGLTPLACRSSAWWSFWGIMLLDFLQILLVMPFVVLAVLALVQDGKTLSEVVWLPDIITAATYGPTVFPILFALILGRMMKAVAYFKLERRTTVRTMEQLQGSRTVVTAFVTQFKMRTLNLLAVAIVLTWALSPVGSQASLRVASIVQVHTDSPFRMSYLDVRNGYSPASYGYSKTLAAGLLTAAIMSPVRVQEEAHDIWGNVRVPLIEGLEGGRPSLDWLSVEGRTAPTPYASLIGMPMMVNSTLEVADRVDLTFSFDTSYWHVACETEQTTNSSYAFPLTTQNNTAGDSVTKTTVMGWDSLFRNVLMPNGNDVSLFPMNETTAGKVIAFNFPYRPRRIYLLANNSRGIGTRFAAVCNLTTTFVTVNATCSGSASAAATNGTGGSPLPSTLFSAASSSGGAAGTTVGVGMSGPQGCRATAIRRSVINETQAAMSLIDMLGAGRDADFFKNFLDATSLGGAAAALGGLGSRSLVSPGVGYLADPANPFGFETNWPDWRGVTGADLGARLARVLNTYWMASVGYKPVQGRFDGSGLEGDSGSGSSGGSREPQAALNGGGFRLLEGSGTAAMPREALRCSKAWAAALLLASGVLLAAAAVTLVLGILRLVPDVLDNFSTMLKDNPFVRGTDCGGGGRASGMGGYEVVAEDGERLNSMMDGFQRARKIRDTVVQFGDVATGSEYGYVAVGTPETVPMQRLRPGRGYL